MATDFAYAAMLIPVLLGIVTLLAVAFFGSKVPIGTGFVGLGRRRIACGFLGALVATLAYSLVESVQLLFWKIGQGHIPASDFQSRLPGTVLYLFVITAPFVVIALSLVGIPILSALRRLRMASVAGVTGCTVINALAWAAVVIAAPYNIWCDTHPWGCGGETFLDLLEISLPVAFAFGVFARLPWLRSQPVAADVVA